MIKIIDQLRYGKITNTIDSSKYIEFNDYKSAEEWGRKYYDEWGRQYKENMEIAKEVIKSPSMSAAVECYCGNVFSHINNYLRFGIDNTKNNIYKEMAAILSIILVYAPRIPSNVVVYRLVCDEFIDELIRNNKNGEIPTQEKGFISTSLTKDIIKSEEPYSYHKNLLKIYVKANSIGIYANSVAVRNEQELILYPNGFFQLIKKPYKWEDKMVYECELFYFHESKRRTR